MNARSCGNRKKKQKGNHKRKDARRQNSPTARLTHAPDDPSHVSGYVVKRAKLYNSVPRRRERRIRHFSSETVILFVPLARANEEARRLKEELNIPRWRLNYVNTLSSALDRYAKAPGGSPILRGLPRAVVPGDGGYNFVDVYDTVLCQRMSLTRLPGVHHKVIKVNRCGIYALLNGIKEKPRT